METHNELTSASEREPMGFSQAVAIGSRLRAVRYQLGLSRSDVQTLSGGEFQVNTLSSYERGERTITVTRLQRLATLYDVAVDQLLPPEDVSGPGWTDIDTEDRPDLSFPTRVGGSENVTIELTKLRTGATPEHEVLRRFVSMLQVQRQDFNGRMITIRAGDVRVIARTFGIAPDAMVRRLDTLGLLVDSRSDCP